MVAIVIQHHETHAHELDIETALEFLNTRRLRGGELVDELRTPADAAAWFVAQGVIHDVDAARWTDGDLARTRSVRDALRDVVDAVVEHRTPSAASVDAVNDALRTAPSPILEVGAAGMVVGHRHDASPADDAIARVVAPILGEFVDGHPERFRTCASPTCRWHFYDASPTGRRRWCDMKSCGNRAKAARHRARAKSAARTGAEGAAAAGKARRAPKP